MNRLSQIRVRFEKLLNFTACVGALTWIAWANYSIVLWWHTPASRDQSHIMEWTEHARIHYLTVAQHNFYSHFQIAAFIGAGFFVLAIASAYTRPQPGAGRRALDDSAPPSPKIS